MSGNGSYLQGRWNFSVFGPRNLTAQRVQQCRCEQLTQLVVLQQATELSGGVLQGVNVHTVGLVNFGMTHPRRLYCHAENNAR